MLFLPSSYGKPLYGLTAKNLRMIAFHVRIRNFISSTIFGQYKTTKWTTFLKFLTQHSQLSGRKLRLTSAVRTKVAKSDNFLKYIYISLFILKQGERKHYIIPYNTGENNSNRNFSHSVLWAVPIWRISKGQIACPLIITNISMKGNVQNTGREYVT